MMYLCWYIWMYTGTMCVLYLCIYIALLAAYAFQKHSRPQQLTMCRSLHAEALIIILCACLCACLGMYDCMYMYNCMMNVCMYNYGIMLGMYICTRVHVCTFYNMYVY